ncbi:MAG: hypothetical protein AAGH64_11145 [Planctomycetota bacterium]
MRTRTLLLASLALAQCALAAPNRGPVVIVNPPRDGSPLLTRVDGNAGAVQTITRSVRPRTQRFGPDGSLLIDRDELIAVRTREPLPTLLISPTEVVDDRTSDEIRRQFPFARRVDTITDDLRRAQRQYLRETGAILTVRTFTHTRAQRVRTEKPAPRVLAPGEPVDARPSRVLPPDDQSPE